jgi:serine/threonine protein kinase
LIPLSTTITGTPRYIPPEITGFQPKSGWSQDIWSLGCILIELFIDYGNLTKMMTQNLYSKIYRSSIIPKIPKEIDDEIAGIINKCFTLDPMKRIDIIEVIEKFNKIFAKYNIKEIEITPTTRIGSNFNNLELTKVKESSKIVYGQFSKDNLDITSNAFII